MTAALPDAKPRVTALSSAHRMRGVAHVVGDAGHRPSYLATISRLLPLEPVCGALSPGMAVRLWRADRLLLATIDDAVLPYIALMLARAAAGRRTAALFLRPQSCFAPGLRARLKRIALHLLLRVPQASLITITPFEAQPEYKLVARRCVYDPEYWDWAAPKHEPTPLAAQIAEHAAGRPVVCMPGSLSQDKAFGFFLKCAQALGQRFCFVAAGRLAPGLEAQARAFTAAGGLLIDRGLSEAEFADALAGSHLLWACYDPSYDQASGIFGRALQMGAVVIVRRGSLIHRLGGALGARMVDLAFGDTPGAVALETAITQEALDSEAERQARAESWRRNFRDTLLEALDLGAHEGKESAQS